MLCSAREGLIEQSLVNVPLQLNPNLYDHAKFHPNITKGTQIANQEQILSKRGRQLDK